MNKIMKKFMISIIEYLSPNRGRKCTKEIGHYLEKIYIVLKSGCNWNNIESDLHYTTYYKKFVYWSNLGVFQFAHQKICELLSKNIGVHNLMETLFMDSTDVLNKYGFEDVNYSFKFKNKKATRVNVIVNQIGIPLSIYVTDASKYDSTLIEKTIDCMSVKIIGSRKYPKYLCADKGYTNHNLKKKLKLKGIYLIYPLKSNNKSIKLNYYQKKKTNELLKKRHINENYFSWHKNNKRMNSRYDRKTCLFTSFCYLAATHIIFNKLN